MTTSKTHSAQKVARNERNLMIEYIDITDLRPDPQNPRLHSDEQVRQIARSIESFGFNVPVLIDTASQVIAGHGRWLAAKFLKMTKVPAIRIEHLSDAQRRAFLIADNRLTEKSTWDERLLAEQFEVLSTLDLDFSLDITGFEIAEIDTSIESLLPAGARENDLADAIPEPTAQHVITETGDLWMLGRHRVLCGDARNREAYSILMESHSAAMIFSDPPYNDPIDGYVVGFGKMHHPEVRNGFRRDESVRVHGLSNKRPRAIRPKQYRRVIALHIHGLAARGRTAGGCALRVFGIQEPLRLD